jgi:hypothetical protein
MLGLLWPVPALLASVACVLSLRLLFAPAGAWRQPRSWLLALLVLIGTLLACRFSWRISPMGERERLEKRTGLDLPFWPSDWFYEDDADGRIVAHLRLTANEQQRLPPGSPAPAADAPSLLAAAAPRLEPEWRAPTRDAELRHYTRCELGWYSVVLLDRKSGKLWATLFYGDSSGELPCSPE